MFRHVVVEQFNAVFTGGIGTNGFVKEMLAQVRVYNDGETEYRVLGSLIPRWKPCIHDLNDANKYPFLMKDLYVGGGSKPFRIYPHSVKLEPFVESRLFSSLIVTNAQKDALLAIKRNENATLKKQLYDMEFEDRRKKQELEDSKHYKAIRSNLLYSEQIGLGIRG